MPGGENVTAAKVARDVGLPLCRAIDSWDSNDYDGVVDLLAPVRGALSDLGGSHAQRDLFLDTLIAARLRSGARGQAIEALQGRLAWRTPHLDEVWMSRLDGPGGAP